jgi:hypothetical protein
MSARSETLGLAIAAGAVIAGLALYVSVTTDAKKRSADATKQQNEESLRAAGEVPTFTKSVESAAPSERKDKPRTGVDKAARKVTQQVDVERTAQLDSEVEIPAVGLGRGADVRSVAPSLDEVVGGETGQRESFMEGALSGEKAPIEDGIDTESGESAQTDTGETEDGDGNTEVDGAENEPADLAGAPVEEKLPKTGSVEELAAMRDVQRHLSRLHSLLLRTDIPPAARENELRKLEAAMKRLSPATRRSMDALVKKGYTARVRNMRGTQKNVTGESLDSNEYGRKDDRPTDVKAVEARIKKLRSTLGPAAQKPKLAPRQPSVLRAGTGGLPTRGSSTMRAVQSGSRNTSQKSGGSLPSVQSNDL